MSNYAATVLLLAGAAVWHGALVLLAPRIGLVRSNFSGKLVFASYGLVAFPYMAAAMVSTHWFGLTRWPCVSVFLLTMAPMWLLGAVDDLFGSREVGGFRGHFRKLLVERRFTTGALKALGGGVVGIGVGWALFYDEPLRWLLTALLIPLMANTLNLLDLRPGRAAAVFFAGLGVTCTAGVGELAAPVAVVAAVALPFAIADSRARAMMGDSGSNMLGSALGLAIVLTTAWYVQAAVVLLLVAAHWYSEKRSFSALIERNTVLRAIDQRLGVRQIG